MNAPGAFLTRRIYEKGVFGFALHRIGQFVVEVVDAGTFIERRC